MAQISQPVFVVGVDHSGTTILYRMTARHPELAWLSQYSLRGGELPGRTRIPLNGWINRIGRRLLGVPWRKEARSLRPEPREGASIWPRFIPRDDGFSSAEQYSAEVAEQLHAVLASDLRKWGRSRLLVKIPYLTRNILLLNRIFPDARFLHIYRDGKAVALSNRKRFSELYQDADVGLTESCVNWRETIAYVDRCQQIIGDRMLELRYETFCGDVHGHLEQVYRFIGLDPGRAQLSKLPETLEVTNEKWFGRCTDEEKGKMNDLLGEGLNRRGYEPFQIPARVGH